MSDPRAVFTVWELPEVLLFHVVSYVDGPTKRATVVCHQLAPLCQSSSKVILKNELSPLWSAILKHDYGAQLNERAGRRSSKRLKQTHLQRVRDAHKMARDNTEIAYHYLSELCARGLTRAALASLIEEYGAQNRINRLTRTGGTFLVECCRARHVKESTILKCVQLLVETYGASVDVAICEQPPKTLTPLCCAAARAMPTVVKYLLNKGADPSIQSTGRFRLYKRPRKTANCVETTALGFAQIISTEEMKHGATASELKELRKVICLLETAEASFSTGDFHVDATSASRLQPSL